jgi:ABC-type transport system involved in cytochrome c biogenesis permease subunit
MNRTLLLATWLLTTAWASASDAEAQTAPDFDWGIWRRLVVHHQARLKPFDTAARETVLEIAGRQEFRPEAFEALSPVEIRDWVALQKFFQAPPKDAERAEPAADGRTDRFKTAETATASPAVRVRDLLSPGMRRTLRDVDFGKDDVLAAAISDLEKQILAKRSQFFPTDAQNRLPHEVRQEATKANAKEVLDLFAKHDEVRAEWLAIQKVKAQLIQELNGVLGMANFYDAQFWLSNKVEGEAADLIAKDPKKLPTHEVYRLNRLLFSTAFPKEIAAAGPQTPHTPTAVRYDPVVLYLTSLFTWGGWSELEKPSGAASGNESPYTRGHRLDAWDHLPVVPAFVELVPFLKQEAPRHVSATTAVDYPPFARWALFLGGLANNAPPKEAEKIVERMQEVERRALRTFDHAMLFRRMRTGFAFEIGPPPEKSPDGSQKDSIRWLSLYDLASSEASQLGAPYVTASHSALKKSFFAARKAFLADDVAAFNEHSKRFAEVVGKLDASYAERLRAEKSDIAERMKAKVSRAGLAVFDFLDEGKEWDAFPTPEMIEREIHYNQLQPFWKTALIAFFASLVLAASLGMRSKIVYGFGFTLLLSAIGMMAYGVGLRVSVAGRAPVTNMFETILWASLVASGVGVVLALVYKRRFIALSAAILLALCSTMAVNLPAEFGSSIKPLQPVLRSQKWLIIHVMTIVASYGAFMLSWLLSVIGLASFFRANPDRKHVKEIASFAYRAMQVGVILLFAGTALGGWWAADSWGRFWGWDPKEVWALIALLTYLLVLHTRFIGVKSFGMMVGSSLAFTMVVGSWYGVNFLFPAGLHAYAFNTGGQQYVIGGVILNLLYVATVWLVKSLRESSNRVVSSVEPTPLAT